MEKENIFSSLEAAILAGDESKVRESAKEIITQKIDPLEALEQGLTRGMNIVGDRFEKGEAYLPELIMAADTFNAAMEVLQPEIEAQKKAVAKTGTVLIGTVQGDVHDIGKNIVATVLGTHGFKVVDIGINNPILKFIEEAEKAQADVIGLSSLMTNTMPIQRDFIETLKQRNLRDKYAVILGGGPVTEEWASSIGADGFAKSAVQAVALVKEIMGRR